MTFTNRFLIAALTAPALAGGALAQGTADRPNIVHIFADDLGYGSLGFTGNTRIQTPSLDSLAAGGMVLNRTYAATVCAPSRAMLMTGLHNGHTNIDRNGNIGAGFIDEEVTVAEVLKDAGYNTALFGKWGFGGGQGNTGQELYSNSNVLVPESLPNSQGFDTFYGYLNHSRAHSYWNDSLWTTEEPFDDNNNGIHEVGEKYYANAQSGLWAVKTGNSAGNVHNNYTHDLVARQSQQYIRDHAGGGDPFYMQVSYSIPHFDIDDIVNAGPQLDLDGNQITGAGNGIYAGQFNTAKQRRYAAMISRMDDSIGALIASLEDPNGDGDTSDSVLDNTLIIFTSDNGGTNADSAPVGFFDANGVFKGGKRDLYEGGVHVAGLMYWQGQIVAGSSYDGLTDLADFMPTAAELAGARSPVGVDGVSLAPTITGQGIQRQRDYLIHEAHENSDFGHARASWMIVQGDYKLIKFNNGSSELYNVVSDPDESNNLLSGGGSAANQQRAADLSAIALAEGVERPDNYFVEYAKWAGSDGDAVDDAAKWDIAGGPAANWSTLVENTAGGSRTALARGIVETLGFEVRGTGNKQTVLVETGATLGGRNEVRIAGQGRIHLDDATLRSVRWTDVLDEGELTGHGTIVGDLYNAATVAPGRPADLPAAPSVKANVNTGNVTAIDFEFIGQDTDPMTNTSALNENLELVQGFSFGPGLAPRNAADAGNEFNVVGYHVSGDGNDSLSGAIEDEDYLTFTIKPVAGVAMTLDEIAVNLWRNGENAAQRYAILTSLDGFTSDDDLGRVRYQDHGIANQHLFSVNYAGEQSTTDAVEVRIYGWSAGAAGGNTHFNDAYVTASFVSVPTVALDPTGVLTLQGDYIQLGDGELAVQLGGVDNTDPLNPQHDQLVVTGTASLAGELALSLDAGFAPSAGDTFAVLTSGGLSGQFDAITGADAAGPDKTLAVSYTASDVWVTVMLLGDMDGDNAVSESDINPFLLALDSPAEYQAQFPSLDPATVGDFNGDGMFTNGDINGFVDVLRGNGVPESSLEPLLNAVPEPSTAMLAAVGGVMTMMRGSRRR